MGAGAPVSRPWGGGGWWKWKNILSSN